MPVMRTATIEPGGERVVVRLHKIPEAEAAVGDELELRLIDVDNEEILERKSVTLRVELDEWF